MVNTVKIKELCDEKGLTFCSLEKEVGLANGSIGKWKTRGTTVESLLKVANYFHVNLQDLIIPG